MEPRLRASPKQFSALVEFMERHGDLSKPEPGPQGRLKSDHLWQEVAPLLNSIIGGVDKSADKWKKVWADWKTKTKKKFLMIRQHTINGDTNCRQSLTALEERLVALIGLSGVTGQVSNPELRYNRSQSRDSSHIDINLVLEVSHADEASPTQSAPPASTSPPPESTSPPPATSPPSAPSSPLPIKMSPPLDQDSLPWPTQSSSPPLPLPSRTTRMRYLRRQASGLPHSSATASRRLLVRAHRNRALTPLDRVVSKFVAIEQRRLLLEEARERRLHEREMQKLRLEGQRIEVAREHNQLLQQLGGIAQNLAILCQRRSRLPSTDTIPE